jgi:hypothetical protein
MQRFGTALVIAGLAIYGLSRVILPAERIAPTATVQMSMARDVPAAAIDFVLLGGILHMLGSRYALARAVGVLVIVLALAVPMIVRMPGQFPFIMFGLIVVAVMVIMPRLPRSHMTLPLWVQAILARLWVAPRRAGIALFLLSATWVAAVRLRVIPLPLRGHEFALVWAPLATAVAGLVGFWWEPFGDRRRGALTPAGERWRLAYTGDWPECPRGYVTVYVGPEIHVGTRDMMRPINAAQVGDMFWQSEGRDARAGWKYRDNNTGREYVVAFRFNGRGEAERFYNAVVRAVHRSQTVWWDEWRPLTISLGMSDTDRSRGGARAIAVYRQVACPRCAAEAVGSPMCPHCGGKRFTTEEDTVNVIVPAGVQPGHTITVPSRGNRDANGVSGPLIITIGESG